MRTITHQERRAAARTIATEQASPLMQLDLIIARLEGWQIQNEEHHDHTKAALGELQKLRRTVAAAAKPPLVILGPGGDFTREILADDGRLGGAF